VFDTPLYLYSSAVNKDVALLVASPSSYNINHPGSYTRVYSEPVAFAAARLVPGVADVALRAYWSEERNDIQTSNWDMVTINEHGGNYTALDVVGYLQSDQLNGSWWSSIAQTPLLLSYSASREDAITGPLNAADANTLVVEGGDYVGKGHVVGYGRAGSCPVCNTTLAAAYPSLGGADCPVTCAAGTSSFTTIYHVGEYHGAGASQFRNSMLRAGNILTSGKFGAASTVISTESGAGLHVSFNYLCCYTDAQKATARTVLELVQWPSLNISFGQPVWRLDNKIVSGSAADTAHHLSIIVLLDDASNKRMEAWVATVEQMLRDAGVPIHLPRSKQQPFHSTLGVVNGLEYANEAALAAINDAIPPKSWTTANVTLSVPSF